MSPKPLLGSVERGWISVVGDGMALRGTSASGTLVKATPVALAASAR
ncbi:MAG: hypothetical protein NTU80_14440 [Verrucomicrobia bacterium]|nr:hypothetical protein [Verrucomicrobiota bacterium]